MIFAALAVIGGRTADHLSQAGVDATATVTDKRTSSDGEGGTTYSIRYSFAVNGETFEDRQVVSRLFYRGVEDGDRIPVRYWRDDPSTSEVEKGEAAAVGLIGQIGTAVATLIALVFGRIAWKRASHATWMARHGFPRQVSIADHQALSVSVNDVMQWKATWVEADGRTGETRMAPREKLPGVGSRITIYVHPQGKGPSLWEGDL